MTIINGKEKAIGDSLLCLQTAKKMINLFLYSKIINCHSRAYLFIDDKYNRMKRISILLGIREKSLQNLLLSSEKDNGVMAERVMKIRKKINKKLINLFLMTKFREDKC